MEFKELKTNIELLKKSLRAHSNPKIVSGAAIEKYLYQLILNIVNYRKNPDSAKIGAEEVRYLQESFVIKKIKTNDLINWHKIIKLLNQNYTPLNTYKENITKFYFIVKFIDCNLSGVLLRESGGKGKKILHLIRGITFESCDIGYVNIEESFYNNIEQPPSLKFATSTLSNVSIRGILTGHIEFYSCPSISFVGAYDNAALTMISFKKCVLGNIKDRNIGINLNNTKFLSTTEFIECTFNTSPKFHGAQFHSDTSFHESKFLDVKNYTAAGDYRVLKQKMHELGAEHDSMMFHALELETRKNTAMPKFWEFWSTEWPSKVAYNFMKATTDFGRNFWLPWVWLVITFVFFFTVYFFSDAAVCNMKLKNLMEPWLLDACGSKDTDNLNINFIYSLKRMLGPVALLIDDNTLHARNGWIKITSVFQILFSSTFWYMIIIQLRRQFRL